jgi:hypothetical protein
MICSFAIPAIPSQGYSAESSKCPAVFNLSIRCASADDEENIVALWRTCGLETFHNDLAQDFRFARAFLAVLKVGEGSD